MTDRQRRARRSWSHPLLGVFPLTVIAVGTFLVVFALLLARVQPGTGGVLNARVAPSLGEARTPSVPLTTRSSGGLAAPSASVAPAPGAGTSAPAASVSTRTSGGGRDSARDE